ncbi:MAG: hypothetical protein ABIP53_09540 [Candidatus Limnocylindrales bacterium]
MSAFRYPDLRNVVVDGVPWIDVEPAVQNRYVEAERQKWKAEQERTDPGTRAALPTADEQKALAAAEQKLAQAEAAYQAASQRWQKLWDAGWKLGPPASDLMTARNGFVVQRKASSPTATKADFERAERDRDDAQQVFQRALIERNRLALRLDRVRTARRYRAEEAAAKRR